MKRKKGITRLNLDEWIKSLSLVSNECKPCDGEGGVFCENCYGSDEGCPSCTGGIVPCAFCEGTGIYNYSPGSEENLQELFDSGIFIFDSIDSDCTYSDLASEYVRIAEEEDQLVYERNYEIQS